MIPSFPLLRSNGQQGKPYHSVDRVLFVTKVMTQFGDLRNTRNKSHAYLLEIL